MRHSCTSLDLRVGPKLAGSTHCPPSKKAVLKDQRTASIRPFTDMDEIMYRLYELDNVLIELPTGELIEVTVLGIKGNQVRIGTDAP